MRFVDDIRPGAIHDGLSQMRRVQGLHGNELDESLVQRASIARSLVALRLQTSQPFRYVISGPETVFGHAHPPPFFWRSESCAANGAFHESKTHISFPTQSEWLNTLQARESTVIPDEILDAVRAEFKKMRATTRADITPVRIKAHLKKLRLSKWYEHTHAICNALEGTPAPTLSPALETKLKTMFHEIQAPFDHWVKIIAPKRKNFLSYGYVLYKMCELLGQDELLQYFALLKAQSKLYQMDAIWKRICGDLKWQFIASI